MATVYEGMRSSTRVREKQMSEIEKKKTWSRKITRLVVPSAVHAASGFAQLLAYIPRYSCTHLLDVQPKFGSDENKPATLSLADTCGLRNGRCRVGDLPRSLMHAVDGRTNRKVCRLI
jgi:hypothetical protein